MRTKVKSGISLIVLVITIIVMIILATAIILSLSNSGIIGKANKAKTDSDTANLKEYVNTLRAEYELMTVAERNGKTFVEYANSKLEEKGYKNRLTEDEILMTESATQAVEAGIKVGDTVTGYTVEAKTYTTSGNENTGDIDADTEPNPQPQTVITDTALTWKYIGIGEDGSLEIAPDFLNKSFKDMSTDCMMYITGSGGYLNGAAELDKACEVLYSVDGKGTAKSMNMDHVIRILGYTGGRYGYQGTDYQFVYTETPMKIGDIEKKVGVTLTNRKTPDGKDITTYTANFINITPGAVNEMKNPENLNLVFPNSSVIMYYWLASPSLYVQFFGSGKALFGQSIVHSGDACTYACYNEGSSSSKLYRNAIRPVVSLNSNVSVAKDTDGVWKIS